MADQWTPKERTHIEDARRTRLRGLTERQLNRRLIGWSAALAVMVIVIIVMTIRG